MKRAEFDHLRNDWREQKRQCTEYFARFKEFNKDAWTYDESLEAFVDQWGYIQAYVRDGIVYYTHLGSQKHVPANLLSLNTQRVPKDVWILVMQYMTPYEILTIEDTCVATARAASFVLKKRGEALFKLYGPVFKEMLNYNKWSYYDFFLQCYNMEQCKEFINFFVLFNLPPQSIAHCILDPKKAMAYGRQQDFIGVTTQEAKCMIRCNNGIHIYMRRTVKCRLFHLCWNNWLLKKTGKYCEKQGKDGAGKGCPVKIALIHGRNVVSVLENYDSTLYHQLAVSP